MNDYIGLRRVPVGNYLKLKKNSLMLYIQLQQLSQWNDLENHRYIPLDSLNKTQISKDINVTLPTIRTKLKVLEDEGLIEYWSKSSGDKEYIILPNVGDYYTLIDLNLRFVKSILALCNEIVLRVFLFHKSYSEFTYRKKQCNTYCVTLDYIAMSIGSSKTNLQKIIQANDILVGFGVLRIDKEWLREDSKNSSVTVSKNYYTWLQ